MNDWNYKSFLEKFFDILSRFFIGMSGGLMVALYKDMSSNQDFIAFLVILFFFAGLALYISKYKIRKKEKN